MRDSVLLSLLVLIVAALAVWGLDSLLPDLLRGVHEMLVLAGG